MCKEYILHSLRKIEETLVRIISNSENIITVDDYYKATSKNCFASDLWNADFVDVANTRKS